ncbi:MAG: nicotinate-nucleotide adenylyltransferase [Rhodospirillaceae bacterium]|jgi:nicotinate-nucleotide adenylyltransferase|nr:nicotinate-nucleotide adenylyltransferase [Rhodospirillaceae bacterium]MBT5660407.1 nicotinate-nucleotide adenylyltransferase [Rhodospirillaceae bacterium]MBT5751611.1 nicotinate-nucleotide adenylyltransferase [Rhodospirillaceae bacterium]
MGGGRVSRRRIGLLGGSFNPAHEGHRYISLLALKQLALHEVWWLVSPRNPMKQADDMAPFDARLSKARKMAAHPRLRVSAIEAEFGTCYTADTLKELKRRFPGVDFVWIMGADNLAQVSHWHRWTEIFTTVPIAIFDRPSYSLRSLSGLAAKRYRKNRLSPRQARRLVGTPSPAWIFFPVRPHPASATAIRSSRKAKRIK